MVPLWDPSFFARVTGRHVRCGQSAVWPSRGGTAPTKDVLDGFALLRDPG